MSDITYSDKVIGDAGTIQTSLKESPTLLLTKTDQASATCDVCGKCFWINATGLVFQVLDGDDVFTVSYQCSQRGLVVVNHLVKKRAENEPKRTMRFLDALNRLRSARAWDKCVAAWQWKLHEIENGLTRDDDE